MRALQTSNEILENLVSEFSQDLVGYLISGEYVTKAILLHNQHNSNETISEDNSKMKWSGTDSEGSYGTVEYFKNRGCWKFPIATETFDGSDYPSWEFTDQGKQLLLPLLLKSLELKVSSEITKRLTILCGDNDVICYSNGYTPDLECKAAKTAIDGLINGTEYSKHIMSNSLYYMKYAVEYCKLNRVELTLQFRGSATESFEYIESLFADEFQTILKNLTN